VEKRENSFLMCSELWEVYKRLSMEEVIDLDIFLRDVKQGKFGRFSKECIRNFLHEMEQEVIKNMELKTLENPSWTHVFEERLDEIHNWFKKLREYYADEGKD
jgi:hypothetical protein